MILPFLAVLLVGSAEPPERCSVGTLRTNPEGYFWPIDSVRGFVTSAEVIVRVRADSVTELRESNSRFDPSTEVHFTVLEAVRGVVLSPLRMRGYFVDHDDYNPEPVPYRMVRMSGQRGSCLTYEYRRGAEYLLILRVARNVIPLSADAVEPRLTPYWAPLAPLNEQIRDANDPWVQWVRSALRSGSRSTLDQDRCVVKGPSPA